MAQNIPEGFASVAIEYVAPFGTGPFYVTFGIALDPNQPLNDHANACFDIWQEHWMENTFTEFTQTRAILTVEAPGGGLGSVVSDRAAVSGTGSGEPALVSTCVVINKITNTLGRRGRGRFFIPGMLGETDVEANGILGPSFIDLYQASAEAWIADMKTPPPGFDLTLPPFLLHTSSLVPPSEITDLRVSENVGSQRRRLR